MEETIQLGVHTHENQPAPAADFVIRLTEKAVEMVKEAIKNESGLKSTAALRVYVEGGGCSGYKYGLDFDEAEAGDDDLLLSQDGVAIFIDQYSAAYLRGTTIDYVSSLNGAGFKNQPIIINRET